MKHTVKITLILIAIFLITQLFGLVTVNKYIKIAEDLETGEIIVLHPNTVLGPVPEVEEKSFSFVYLMLGILIGTALVLFLIRIKIHRLWKYWFLLAVFATLAVAFGVYINQWAALILALILSVWKVFRPNVYVHNLTEIFIYTGIVIIFLPILNLFSAFILLIVISIYDAIAVWKSKHMIKLAKFQTKAKIFAGLNIPYKLEKKPKVKAGEKLVKIKRKVRTAILGGGDIAFPLLFSGTVMEHLIIVKEFSKPFSLLMAGIVSLCATAALLYLFYKAEQEKFYPAMPFLTVGCFIGYGVVFVITLM